MNLNVDVLVDGRPLDEYAARGPGPMSRLFEGSEYEVRIHNPIFLFRVAVGPLGGWFELLSMAPPHHPPGAASKWVMGPYQTIPGLAAGR